MAFLSESRLLSLPYELREIIYQYVLVVAPPLYLYHDRGSDKIQLFTPERRRQWLALLFTNRQIYVEATPILYSSAQFTIIDVTHNQAHLLQCFLNRIGPVNARYLSNLCINFPFLASGSSQKGMIILLNDDVRCLKLLQEYCVGLRTLETIVHTKNAKGLARASQDMNGSEYVREALSQVDAHFKTIPSLRRVVVKFHNGPPTRGLTKLMEGLGWVVTMML